MGMESFATIAQSFQDLASGKLARELQINRDKSQAEAVAYEKGVEAGKQIILNRMPPKTREKYSKPKPVVYKTVSPKTWIRREKYIEKIWLMEKIVSRHKSTTGKSLSKKALREAVRKELEHREVQRVLNITNSWKW